MIVRLLISYKSIKYYKIEDNGIRKRYDAVTNDDDAEQFHAILLEHDVNADGHDGPMQPYWIESKQ